MCWLHILSFLLKEHLKLIYFYLNHQGNTTGYAFYIIASITIGSGQMPREAYIYRQSKPWFNLFSFQDGGV